jgi:hypothetical protein
MVTLMRNRIFLYPYAGPSGRNYFKQQGTIEDLKRLDIELKEGNQLAFYCDDADDAGRPDEMNFDGTVHFDAEASQWYVLINDASYRLASTE